MKTTQSRQKSYANKKRRTLEFDIGDKVFPKTSPVKTVMRFCQKGKLSPRYIRSFEVIGKVGKVAYRLAQPLAMTRIHDVFHVSILRKFIADPAHILKHAEVEIISDQEHEV